MSHFLEMGHHSVAALEADRGLYVNNAARAGPRGPVEIGIGDALKRPRQGSNIHRSELGLRAVRLLWRPRISPADRGISQYFVALRVRRPRSGSNFRPRYRRDRVALRVFCKRERAQIESKLPFCVVRVVCGVRVVPDRTQHASESAHDDDASR